MRLFLQSLLIIFSFVFIFTWQNTALSEYTIPAIGFLIFLFLLTSVKKKNLSPKIMGNESVLIFILNTVIFLLIFSTGGFSSSLFFILYFLAFGIAFVFEPETVFVFVLGTILIFLPNALKDNIPENLLRLGSLVILSPLAYLFGKEYRHEQKQEENLEAIKERTKEAADTISKDVEEILEEEKQSLKGKDLEKLNEILEETEDLRQESK